MSVFVASIGFGLVTAAVLALASVASRCSLPSRTCSTSPTGSHDRGGIRGLCAQQRRREHLDRHAGGDRHRAVASVFLNNVVYTPFKRRGASPIALVIVSLGMTLILEFGTQRWPSTNVSYAMSQGATVKVGSIELTVVQLVIIALSVVVMVLVHGLIRYTRLGKAMRATAANRIWLATVGSGPTAW